MGPWKGLFQHLTQTFMIQTKINFGWHWDSELSDSILLTYLTLSFPSWCLTLPNILSWHWKFRLTFMGPIWKVPKYVKCTYWSSAITVIMAHNLLNLSSLSVSGSCWTSLSGSCFKNFFQINGKGAAGKRKIRKINEGPWNYANCAYSSQQ